jgi:hypothetical protein
MNIYQKLIEVRKAVPYLQKEAKGYQFNYVASSQVLGALKSKMDEIGLLLIPSITGTKVTEDIYEKVDNKGSSKRTVDYFTEVTMNYTWINAEKPEEQITVPWYGQGLDTGGEKGVGKALTYAEKYFMLKFFNIPIDKDDPDSFQQKFEDKEEKPKENGKKFTPNVDKVENPEKTTEEGKHHCDDCKAEISPVVYNFSMKTFKKGLCMDCQKKMKGGK